MKKGVKYENAVILYGFGDFSDKLLYHGKN